MNRWHFLTAIVIFSSWLTVTFVDWEGGFTISDSYPATPWDAAAIEGAYPSQLSWVKRNESENWSVPGSVEDRNARCICGSGIWPGDCVRWTANYHSRLQTRCLKQARIQESER